MRAIPREELLGHAAMLVFAIAISVSFSLGARAAGYMDPAALTTARFALAALLLGAFAAPLARRGHFRASWRYLVIGALYGGYFILMFEALRLTQPVSLAAIFTLTPIMSAVFGWLLMRQRTTPVIGLSLLIGGAGALWVIFRGDLSAFLALDFERGEWIYLIGCASHALYTPMVRFLNRGEPAPVFGFGSLVGGLAVWVIWAHREILSTDWPGLPPIVWGTIVYLGVVATAGTFLLTRFATMRLPASKVMAYGYLVPSLVIFWEGLLTGQWVPGIVWVGLGITLVALLTLLTSRSQ